MAFRILGALAGWMLRLLAGVLGEGAIIPGAGILAGALGGVALMRVASGVFGVVRMPGVLPIAGAATLLLIAAVPASLLPAARASRVDALTAFGLNGIPQRPTQTLKW